MSDDQPLREKLHLFNASLVQKNWFWKLFFVLGLIMLLAGLFGSPSGADLIVGGVGAAFIVLGFLYLLYPNRRPTAGQTPQEVSQGSKIGLLALLWIIVIAAIYYFAHLETTHFYLATAGLFVLVILIAKFGIIPSKK
jgi:membrane associated rhomboid family serine protease